MDFSLPGSSVYGIFQARVLEWGAIAFSDPLVYKIQKKKKKAQIINFQLKLLHSKHIHVNPIQVKEQNITSSV